MEITSVSKNELRIKNKQATILVNPTSNVSGYNGAIFLKQRERSDTFIQDDTLLISGPGEFEIGGIKIKGIVQSGLLYFNIDVDGVGIVLGNLSVLEKVHSKLQESQIVVAFVDVSSDPSFLTGFATNVLVYFGEESADTIKTFVKEGVTESTKISYTKDKLPQEMETFLLTGR